MEIDNKAFKKMFPNLAKEIDESHHQVALSSIRSDIAAAEKISSEKFLSYNPDAVDYIRRCDNKQQAEEIISYLENRKEISRNYAKKLRRQLRQKGLGSFGPRKDDDYYLKHGIV